MADKWYGRGVRSAYPFTPRRRRHRRIAVEGTRESISRVRSVLHCTALYLPRLTNSASNTYQVIHPVSNQYSHSDIHVHCHFKPVSARGSEMSSLTTILAVGVLETTAKLSMTRYFSWLSFRSNRSGVSLPTFKQLLPNTKRLLSTRMVITFSIDRLFDATRSKANMP